MGPAVSEREKEVLNELSMHRTNAEIAQRLYISVRTVETHVASLLRKLGATDRRDLAARASEILGGLDDQAEESLGLPVPLTSFVGRTVELKGLLRVLLESRLVTLVGPGGVGKTRLAIAAARSLEDGPWLRGVFVNLVTVSPDFVDQAIAAVLGVGESPDESLEQVLLQRLRARPRLLVLDNCEHVLPAVAELVAAVLQACPRTVVLATSRQRLDVEGERVFTVVPLSLSPTEGAEELSEAGRLFVDRSGPAADEDNDVALIAEICRRLEGIPLAIELAAARRQSLGLDGLLAGIDDRLRLLKRLELTGDRHGSLRSMIDWSYDLLEEEERSIFRRLGEFHGAWGRPAQPCHWPDS